MLKRGRVLPFAAILTLVATSAQAQGSRVGYFTDDYLYKYQMNPAIANDGGFFSFPGVGDLNVGVSGNMALSDYLFPNQENGLNNFMNPDVSAQDFLSRLSSHNQMQLNMNWDLLAFGFNGFGGYNTFTAGFRLAGQLSVPYAGFEFLKKGMDDGDVLYDLSDINGGYKAFFQVALGHSHQINDRLSIGATLKLLSLGHKSEVSYDRLIFSANEDQWLVDVSGEYYTTLDLGNYSDTDALIEEALGSRLTSAWGIGVDLGVTYKLTEDLQLSGSIVDLGFMHWGDITLEATQKDPFIFDGFDGLDFVGDDTDQGFKDQLGQLKDDLSEVLEANIIEETEQTERLATTIYLGAEYKLPSYDKLSFGLLSTTYVNNPYTFSEIRLSANLAPTKWFAMTATGQYSKYGYGWGGMINISPCGFNIYAGVDMIISKLTPQFVPTGDLNANVNIGVAFPLYK